MFLYVMNRKINDLVIVNYGLGNLRSIFNQFNKLGVNCTISSDLKIISSAKKLVLPGVGNFKYAIENLEAIGIIEILNNKVINEKTPILGICLGMQLMGNTSEEGGVKGLGWINAETKRFDIQDDMRFKIPNIGWNNTLIVRQNELSKYITAEDYFYFVHSYYMVCNDPKDVWMKSIYESEFVSAINRGNIFGTQFHPEKSHAAGLNILKSFAEY